MTQRTDIHKPSLLDPAEYTFLAAFYQGDSDAMYEAYRWDMKEYDEFVSWDNPTPEARKPGTQVFDGNFTAKRTCDHCGAAYNHGVLFKHIPTGDLIHVGHICAADTLGLPSKAAATKKKAEKAAREEAERIKRHKEREAWQNENADVVAWLTKYGVEVKDAGRKSHPFLDDMVRSFYKWGSLFDRQAEAVRKFMVNENKPKPAAEPEPTTPLEEGRRVIEGTVVSAKIKDSDFGIQFKMLVRQDDGNKVWGTIPNSIIEQGYDVSTEGMKGLRVTLTATVERSRDDEHFGFYKRPTGAKAEEVAA